MPAYNVDQRTNVFMNTDMGNPNVYHPSPVVPSSNTHSSGRPNKKRRSNTMSSLKAPTQAVPAPLPTPTSATHRIEPDHLLQHRHFRHLRQTTPAITLPRTVSISRFRPISHSPRCRRYPVWRQRQPPVRRRLIHHRRSLRTNHIVRRSILCSACRHHTTSKPRPEPRAHQAVLCIRTPTKTRS
jgi:hypothetical protein